MNIGTFSSCGQELRVGLRSGAAGTQSSNSLSWAMPNEMQYFVHAPDSVTAGSDLPGDMHALNARQTVPCVGGGVQSWSGDVYY